MLPDPAVHPYLIPYRASHPLSPEIKASIIIFQLSIFFVIYKDNDDMLQSSEWEAENFKYSLIDTSKCYISVKQVTDGQSTLTASLPTP